MQFLENVSLQSFNSLGMPVRARWYCEASNEEELQEALAFAREKQIEIMPLGGGTNLVLLEDIDALVIHVRLKGLTFSGDQVDAAAGENWHSLVERTVEAGLSGLENLALIPGCVGAAPIQNIGAYGVELSDRLREVSTIHARSGEFRRFSLDDCEFGYRHSIFKAETDWIITGICVDLSAPGEPQTGYPGIAEYLNRHGMEPGVRSVFEAVVAIRQEKLPDPAVAPNVGSFFKNPIVDADRASRLAEAFPAMPRFDATLPGSSKSSSKLSAAWLIDQAGFKGYQVDGFGVSDQHALVIVREGQGSPAALRNLVQQIREGVGEKFGVALDIEPSVYPRDGLDY